MRLLVLGGTRFVGRTVVADAMAPHAWPPRAPRPAGTSGPLRLHLQRLGLCVGRAHRRDLTVVDADPASGAEDDYAVLKRGAELGILAGFLEVDTSYAARTGLVCRPVEETVADTWAWMQRGPLPPQRPDRPVHGLPPGIEQRLLQPDGPAAPTPA